METGLLQTAALVDFRALFESAPGSCLALSPELTIVAVSDEYLRATMTKRIEILDRGLFEVFPDHRDDRAATGIPHLRISLKRVAETKLSDTMAVEKCDIRQRVDGGSKERYWRAINSPVLGENNEIRYIMHRIEDVTDYVRLGEQAIQREKMNDGLRTRAEQAEKEVNLRAGEVQEATQRCETANHRLDLVNKELEAFGYSVSHDLRAPLRGVDGFSQALLEDYGDQLDSQAKEYLERIRLGAQRMAGMIDDLLSLSRITRAPMVRHRVNLSAMVQEIAQTLANRDPSRRVDFVIAPDLQPEVDPRLMRIALENLLGNSWKFTSQRPEGRVEFGRTQENGAFVYFVRDNGAGFDPAYAGRLFGAFQRLHAVTEFPGTGIGLATVQRIIHRHGGRIWADSAVNQGASFYFTV